MEQADDLAQRSARLLEHTQKLVDRAQAMLSQLQSFQEALVLLRAELTAHDQQLQSLLKPQRPAPHPPAAFIEPAVPLFPWEVTNEKEPEPLNQPERRADVRRGGNLVAAVLRREPDQDSVAWVLDRSLGGLGLLAGAAVQVGDILRVRPCSAEENNWLQVEVRDCRPLGSSWRLGCRFVGQPTWEQVRLLG